MIVAAIKKFIKSVKGRTLDLSHRFKAVTTSNIPVRASIRNYLYKSKIPLTFAMRKDTLKQRDDNPHSTPFSSKLPVSGGSEESKNFTAAKIIAFPDKPYNARVSIEQLQGIWNDGDENYSDAELLVIRDWLYTIAEVITEVINSPGFTPPQITRTDAQARKAKHLCLPSSQSKSISIDIPQYKELRTAS